MTLIPCKECKHSVSDKAAVCPNCGIRNPSKVSGGESSLSLFIVVGCLALLIIGLVYGGQYLSQTPNSISNPNTNTSDNQSNSASNNSDENITEDFPPEPMISRQQSCSSVYSDEETGTINHAHELLAETLDTWAYWDGKEQALGKSALEPRMGALYNYYSGFVAKECEKDMSKSYFDAVRAVYLNERDGIYVIP
jgi:hypothetical protein